MTAARLLGGRYEVGEVIGRGGMADVHAGYDTRLSRQVAIKLLRADLARDVTFLSRFRREAQSAAGLSHPNIVAIFDSGEDTTTDASGASVQVPYIVMEVVRGQTLREQLRAHGPLAVHEASRVTEEVLAALAYSHRMGIVHRDIKPANVMVGATGEVKVMDFGIARAVADSAATMTQTSAVIGTAQYLSPEQAQGKPVDARSDLYSTGCMLFELLTGRPPFVGETPVAIAYQHVGEVPQRPSDLREDVPEAFDAVVLHAMVKDREARYQNATDMRADLLCAREGRQISSAALGTAAIAEGLTPTSIIRVVPDPTRPVDPWPVSDLDGPVGPSRRADRRENPEDPPKRRRAAYVLLALAAIAGLAVLFLLGRDILTNQTRPEQAQVPQLVGLTEDQARAALSSRRLVLDPRAVTNASVAKGIVIDQDVPLGTMLNVGSSVKVNVSSGPGQAAVPVTAGLAKDAAVTAIKLAGFPDPVVLPVDDPSQAKDVAVGTDPAAGTVAPLTQTITVKVATGKVKVPQLVGKYTATAQALVEGVKLVYELGDQVATADTKVLEGTVLSQDHPADSLVDVGTTIKVTIAIRAAAPTVTVTNTVTPAGPTGTSPPTTP
jgi:serine/threonine protein kinase